MGSTNDRPPFLGPGFPTYPVHTQVVHLGTTAAGATPSGLPIFPATVEQWTGADFRDRESCYVVVGDNVGRLVGSYNGLPLYGVGQVSNFTLLDWTNLTFIVNNTTLNITGNFYYTFLTTDTFITVTGGPTNIWIFEVPLKIDDWLFAGYRDVAMGSGTGTLDLSTGQRALVYRIQGAGVVINKITPAPLPAGAPANNGQLFLLFNCNETDDIVFSSIGVGANVVFPDQAAFTRLTLQAGGGIWAWYDPESGLVRLVVEANGATGAQTVVTGITWDPATCELTVGTFTNTYVNGRVQNVVGS